MTRKEAAFGGFGWGCIGGVAFVGSMYYAGVFLGLRPLPQLLNEPLLSLMPGFVFGFLIDTLQHAGKVVEGLGLIILMVALLGALGAASAVAGLRWTSRYLPFAFAAIGWLAVTAIVLPLGGAGFLGLNDGPATPLIWAALFAIYAVVLQFGEQPPSGVDAGRRRLLSTVQFRGVRLRDLVAMVLPQAQASWVSFKARDGYTESLPLSLVEGAPEILVAYQLDGAPLPVNHGFPARILIPGHYGMKGPKWLENIDLANHETGGYWEQQGWDHNAVVKTTARFDVPREAEILKVGTMEIGGVAFAGTRGISKVEYTTNGGSTWEVAQFDAALSPLTWVVWRATWTPGSEGAYRLMVRATDASGATQDSHNAPSYPSGASGFHTIHVNVSG